VVGTTNDTVYQFDLSIPWNVSSATQISGSGYANQSVSVSAQSTTPVCVVFSLDGTKMYVLENNNDTIYQYSLVGGGIDITATTNYV